MDHTVGCLSASKFLVFSLEGISPMVTMFQSQNKLETVLLFILKQLEISYCVTLHLQ